MKILQHALALSLIGFWYFFHLNIYPLWNDEASTLFFGKSVLSHGYPLAWVDHQLSIWDQCTQINEALFAGEGFIGQHYLEAFSLKVIGPTLFGARFLFVWIGLSAYFPLYRLLKFYRISYPIILSTALMLLPQHLLLMRQARYYPVVITLSLWLLIYLPAQGHVWKKSILWLLLSSMHTLIAGLMWFVGFFCMLQHRPTLKKEWHFLIVPCCLMSWYYLFEPIHTSRLPIMLLLEHNSVAVTGMYGFQQWIQTLSDLEYMHVFPLFFLMVLSALGYVLQGVRFFDVFRYGSGQLCLWGCLFFPVSIAFIFGTETTQHYAILRYMCMVGFMSWPIFYAMVFRFILKPWLACMVCLSALYMNMPVHRFYNVFSHLSERETLHISDIRPIYGDIIMSLPNGWMLINQWLRTHAPAEQQILHVYPFEAIDLTGVALPATWVLAPYYLRDDQCWHAIEKKLGALYVDYLKSSPNYILVWGNQMVTPDNATEVVRFSDDRIFDGTRPELVRRGRRFEENAQDIVLYHFNKSYR